MRVYTGSGLLRELTLRFIFSLPGVDYIPEIQGIIESKNKWNVHEIKQSLKQQWLFVKVFNDNCDT